MLERERRRRKTDQMRRKRERERNIMEEVMHLCMEAKEHFCFNGVKCAAPVLGLRLLVSSIKDVESHAPRCWSEEEE